jgi:hypothetical protein
MSKMDALRAMREARFEESAAPHPPADQRTPDERPCGHRSISGRTCTREHGHAAKSHRYS